MDVRALLAGLPARIDAIPRKVAARTPDAPALALGGRASSITAPWSRRSTARRRGWRRSACAPATACCW